MNADDLLQRGCDAWLPSTNASDLRVLYLTEVPTVGTFDCRGARMLFRCLSGHMDRVSLWAYTGLAADEAAEADSVTFTDVRDMQTWLDEHFRQRWVWFATAVDGEVDCWSERHHVSDDLLSGAEHFLKDLLRASGRKHGAWIRGKAIRRRKAGHAEQQALVDEELRRLAAMPG